jgi:hypothetical protein
MTTWARTADRGRCAGTVEVRISGRGPRNEIERRQADSPLEEPVCSLAIETALAIDTALKQGTPTSRSSLSGTRRYK